MKTLLKNLFKSKPVIDDSYDPHKQYRELMQSFEDSRIEHDIKLYVKQEFNQWLNANVIDFDGKKVRCYILAWFPTKAIGHYTIHDEATAKYINASFHDMCQQEFDKLKKEHAYAS